MTKKEHEKFLEGIILAGKYSVGAFPNLKLFPKNYKDGEEFYGGCDLDGCISKFKVIPKEL
jgi:hypothetical protein